MTLSRNFHFSVLPFATLFTFGAGIKMEVLIDQVGILYTAAPYSILRREK